MVGVAIFLWRQPERRVPVVSHPGCRNTGVNDGLRQEDSAIMKRGAGATNNCKSDKLRGKTLKSSSRNASGSGDPVTCLGKNLSAS